MSIGVGCWGTGSGDWAIGGGRRGPVYGPLEFDGERKPEFPDHEDAGDPDPRDDDGDGDRDLDSSK